jgi:hypothetical protein
MSRTQIDASLVPSASLASQNVANILDNGGFEIWQRGTSFSNPATATYLADRWKINTTETSTVTVTQEATTIDTGLYSMKVVMSSTGASKLWQLFQPIENYVAYRTKTVTLSIRVKTSTASSIRVVVYDGVTLNYSPYHTGGGGWETLTSTLTVDASAARLEAYVGAIQAGDKKDGTYYFDSAMLTVGSTANAFIPTNPQVDLARCMRYFQVLGGFNGEYICFAQALGANNMWSFYRFPVPMRVAPTATVNNATNFQSSRANGLQDNLTSFTTSVPSTNGIFLGPVSVNLVAGNVVTIMAANNNASIYFSADF